MKTVFENVVLALVAAALAALFIFGVIMPLRRMAEDVRDLIRHARRRK